MSEMNEHAVIGRDDTFRAFTEGLARTIRAEERKRLWRLVIGVGVIILILVALLVKGRNDDHNLRLKLRDQCQARNTILDLQRELYQRMVVLDGTDAARREVWGKISASLPQNRNCDDFMR